MYLTFGGDIKLESFEVQDSCNTWWTTNVVQTEKRKKLLCLIITTTCMIKRELLATYAMVRVESKLLYNAYNHRLYTVYFYLLNLYR